MILGLVGFRIEDLGLRIEGLGLRLRAVCLGLCPTRHPNTNLRLQMLKNICKPLQNPYLSLTEAEASNTVKL